MPFTTLPLNRGSLTGIDPSLLGDGELQESTGVVYFRGDPAAHKIPGRISFGTPSSGSAVNGLRFVSFNNNNDYVLAQSKGTLYSSLSGSGTFASIRTGLTASAAMINATKFADALFCCNGTDTNWMVKNDNTTIRQSLTAQTVAPTGSTGGTGITGTFIYWATEYDQTNDVESAVAATGATYAPGAVANKTITVTKPATLNSSATHWRLYRTKDLGSFPVGWLVATVAIATTTYADSTTDASLVLLTPYPVVTINGALEGQNQAAPIFTSIATHEGRLIGVSGRFTYFSEVSVPHYFPTSYAIQHFPPFGGQGRCVRSIGSAVLVFFDNDCFRINYLPSQNDATFDAGVVQEHVAHYGTPSPLGAVSFDGWGGSKMVFFACRSNPMLTDGQYFDTAVKQINWAATVPLSVLSTCVCVNNPDQYRIEMYYNDSAADATSWKCLHFYYDPSRARTEQGGFPELAWTGPHLVPGPAVYGTYAGAGRVWTGSRTTSGTVYQEGVGFSDAANLADSSGTVQFRLRSRKLYAQGVASEATVGRIFVHKSDTATGNYATTLTTYYEGVGSKTKTQNISAVGPGATSEDFNQTGQSFDVRVVHDTATFMPPINNLTLDISDVSELEKTNRYQP